MWNNGCNFLLLVAICIKSGFSSPLSSETSAPLSSETSERTTGYEDVVSTHSLLALTSMQAFLKNYCLNELDSCSSNPDDNNFENYTKTGLQLNLLNYALINNMSAVLNQMVSEEKEKSLPERCIEAIRSHDMEEAVKILSSFKKINRINLVINRVYEHNILNFEKVFNFCVNINDTEKSKIAFDALYYEIKSSGHMPIENIEKMRNQMKSFKLSSKTNANAIVFINQIYDQLLATQIESMYQPKGETETILNYIKSLKFKDMKIFAFKILLQKMKEDKFSRGSILQVAYQLNKTLQEESYAGKTDSKDLSEAKEMILDITESEDQSEKLMNLLPECIKNVVSSEDVCIKSSLYDEYLYASDIRQVGHNDLRHVFTWVPLNASCHNFDKVWSVKFLEDGKEIILINKKYREVMYVSHVWAFHNDKENKRSVNICPNRIIDFNTDGRAHFILKPVGDQCIMITAKGSTVYVSEETHDGENRLVLGKSSPIDTNDNSSYMMFEVA